MLNKVEEVEIEEVKVKIKRKSDYFLIVKWIIGIYFIGVIMNFNSYVLSITTEFIYTKLMTSSFMTIELVDFADLIRRPLIPLAVTLPLFIPSVAILLLVKLFLDKSNLLPGRHKTVYMIAMSTMIALVTVSSFLFS